MEKNGMRETMVVRVPEELKRALEERARSLSAVTGMRVTLSQIVVTELTKALKQPLPVVRVPGAVL